jgi:AhpD family alkylhydroperoxidase
MEDMKKVLAELDSNLKKFAKEYPEQTNAFFGFMGAVEKEGALDKKTKELIAIALSVVQKCHWCIAYHVDSALKEGATKDEIMESAYVAVLMGGGPALAYSQYVKKALDDLKK